MMGFHRLIFIDFSCDKFPAISWSYCEKHTVQAANEIHDYCCASCQRSFPIDSALKLHQLQSHHSPSKFICDFCNHDYATKIQLDNHKQTQQMTCKTFNDTKRSYLTALSLMPRCALGHVSNAKILPEVNYKYHDRLKSVESLTADQYQSLPISMDEDDSDSSQS